MVALMERMAALLRSIDSRHAAMMAKAPHFAMARFAGRVICAQL
ncbi:hypothetical protein [Rhizobium rhizogenes]|nr:hypothetical protein [Rhizobium rhizogenes]